MRLMFLAPLAGVVASFLSGLNLTSTEGAIHSDNNNEGAGQKLASEYKKNEYFRSWRYSFSHVMGYNKKNN